MPARDAQGTVTVEDGGGLTLHRLRFAGGDAQIRVVGEARRLDVANAVFERGWRGVLATSPSASVQVYNAHFVGQQHNGISFSPGLGGLLACTLKFKVAHVTFLGQVNAAVLLKNCGSQDIGLGEAFLIGLALGIEDVGLQGTGRAGIVLVNSGPFHFDGVHILGATTFGILAHGSALWLTDSDILGVLPRPSDGGFGDGISLWPLFGRRSEISMNTIEINAARAGVSNYGSIATLANTTITASIYGGLVGGDYPPEDPFDYVYNDGGGNVCNGHACTAEPAQIQAPEAVPSE